MDGTIIVSTALFLITIIYTIKITQIDEYAEKLNNRLEKLEKEIKKLEQKERIDSLF